MNIPCNWNNHRRCGPSVALFILSLDMRKDVRDLNAHTLGLFYLSLLNNANSISIKHVLFIPSGNKNLLKLHPMWQELLKFYEENNCLVNESDWPRT